jgi:hypothetical protein
MFISAYFVHVNFICQKPKSAVNGTAKRITTSLRPVAVHGCLSPSIYRTQLGLAYGQLALSYSRCAQFCVMPKSIKHVFACRN